MNEGHGRRVLSPADLPPALQPRRDLWPGIAQAIAGLPQDATLDPGAPRSRAAQDLDAAAAGGASSRLSWRRSTRPRAWTYGLGLAATVACLAIGAWIGRATLPAPVRAGDPALQAAAFAPDARFTRERQALLVQAGLGLARLAPEERRQGLLPPLGAHPPRLLRPGRHGPDQQTGQPPDHLAVEPLAGPQGGQLEEPHGQQQGQEEPQVHAPEEGKALHPRPSGSGYTSTYPSPRTVRIRSIPSG